MTEKEKHEGNYDKKRLAGVMGAASTVVVIALVSFFSVGMVAGALGVGMGGFVAGFGNVEADEGGVIYPVLDEQPACDQAPQLEANLDGEVIIDEYVEFYKDLPLPAGFGEDADQNPRDIARISIASDLSDGDDEVQADDLTLRLSALNAAVLDLGDGTDDSVEIFENSYQSAELDDNTDPEDAYSQARDGTNDFEFGIDATGTEDGNPMFVINDGVAAAHQVAFADIQLPDVDLFVSIGSDQEFADDSPVVERVVEPDDRDCESLAEASTPDQFDTYPSE